ncbi:MAG: hypothetical protein K940chlam9_00413 [Chlamydiae bacterium]|nr:hypothetical protein [Chlamydiota bacterium]
MDVPWEQPPYGNTLLPFLLQHSLSSPPLIKGWRRDLAYTIKGENPVYKEHRADALPLAYPFQIDRIQYRSVRDKNRTLFVKIHRADLHSTETPLSGDILETKIELGPSDVITEFDDPSWYFGFPLVQLSTFQTWEEVSEWGSSLYQSETAPQNTEIMELVSSWIDSNPNKENLVIQALDFVQNEMGVTQIKMRVTSLIWV